MAVSDVYREYESLTQSAASGLGGSLLLVAGLDARGTALTTAANIAGAATLAMEDDPSVARAAVRAGVCDFMVTNLDESLRILKNEVRKKKPVAVALNAGVQAALAECRERGLRPDLVASPDLAGVGGRVVTDAAVNENVVVRWTAPQGQSLALTKVDGLAATVIKDDRDSRRRWLALAPRYAGRPMLTERYVRMNASEAESFSRALRSGIADGTVPRCIALAIESPSPETLAKR